MTSAVFLRTAVALGLAASFLTGCANSTSEFDSDASPTPPLPLATSEPSEPSGLGPELAPLVESVMRVMAVPGAVVLVRTSDTTWQQAFGSRTVGQTDPVTIDDRFRIGSITKTMVGTVMLQLVDEGAVDLDDPVSKYRPDVPNGDEITIADLLDMRSGLFSYTENRSFNSILDNDPNRIWSPEELLRYGLEGTPYFEPGKGFRYSNTNTVLAGLIIEGITGTPLGTELQRRIFTPLNLHDTNFPVPEDNTLASPAVHGYLYGTNVSALSSPALPDELVARVRAGILLPTDVTTMNPTWIWAAGGTVSTAGDVADYADRLVGDNPLLSPDTQRTRMDSVGSINSDPAVTSYGLGLESFGPVFGHDGAIPGFQSFMGRDPVRDITVVVLCNVRDGPAGGRPANEIAYGIIRNLYATG